MEVGPSVAAALKSCISVTYSPYGQSTAVHSNEAPRMIPGKRRRRQ